MITFRMGTFLSVVFISIDIGLLVGIVLSLSCIFFKGIQPYSCLLGRIADTDLYLDVSRYKAAVEIDGVKIFHFCGCLNFCSKSIFKNDLYSLIKIESEGKHPKNYDLEVIDPAMLQHLILDFSALSYVDPSGVSFIRSLVKDFQKLSVSVYIAASSPPVFEMMQKCGILATQCETFKLFPSVNDAVNFALDQMVPIIKTDVMSCYL